MGEVKILGVKIDNLIMDEALKRVEQMMNDNKQHYIVTANPEFLVQAQKDKEFRGILNSADLAVADGIGLIFASWFLGRSLKQRITGVDLMEKICQLASQKRWPIFLLGGKEGIAERAAENLKQKYRGLEQLQLSSSLKNCSIGAAPKYLLFVALGAPKQEKWLVKNLKKMPSVKLAMGVGGAFDFLAGRVWRAPKILRAGGLEWFWRLALQPWRIGRIFRAVVIFPWLVILFKVRHALKARP
ncbi:MAG: hypothetical protein A3J64_03120 [Candidatus Portnoybacteria bacterium RIFCSPHIGHO2_12_FULL_38_9]|uniref:Uncharacterized protein n=1 Tax=Candidatus Portnoybacteria bacterium RIFCSPHIGHO2_12_FULL_38_9 TaxID=1801997 RepID=A0A1G2FET5_9BACT|nr:MAG: hypothetical protein A3J64_03120 [Candidatus Portnoybacteria bacterium RIFCSPHIGHO2_12_FULL_38_9]